MNTWEDLVSSDPTAAYVITPAGLTAEIVLNDFRKVSYISRDVFVALAVGSCLHDEDLPVPPCDRRGVRLFAI